MNVSVFCKKHNSGLFLIFLVISVFQFQCNSSENEISTSSSAETTLATDSLFVVNEGEQVKETVAYVKNKSLIFFVKNNTEYQSLLNRSGQVANFDLKLLLKRFKRLAKEFSGNIKKYGIQSELLEEKKIIFVKDSGQYVFERAKLDLVLGQVFFDGHDSIYIIDGYMEPADLRAEVKSFFKIDSLKINADNIHLKIDTIYNKKKNNSTKEKSTEQPVDTASSGM